ncbi:MAG TPA: methyl-accepting chemotaxis protein [Spirochaetia bacterium]|nr:methyl-accepting chemotaxis protein [Spirochaetia bacterium]
MLKNVKISAKLTIVGTLIIAVPLVAFAVIALNQASARINQVMDELLLTRAQDIAGAIDNIYEGQMRLALSVANNPVIVAAVAARSEGIGTKAALEELQSAAADQLAPFRYVAELGGAYESVALIDENGSVFASSKPQAIGIDVSDREYFKKVIGGHANVGAPVVSTLTGKPITPVVVPVRAHGKVAGAFALMLKIDFLEAIVAKEKVGTTGYLAVVDGTGLAIAHPKVDLVMKLNIATVDGMKSISKDMIEGKAGVSPYVFQGVRKIGGFAPVRTPGWSVILNVPLAEHLAAVNALRLLLTFMTIVALVVAILIYLLFARAITRPLSRGVEFAQIVASGDFSTTLDIDRGDEVGLLAQALNTMSAKLSDLVGTVQNSARDLAESSEQISGSAQKLAEGAQNQSSSLEATSASMEELSASVSEVAENAQSQAAAAKQGVDSMTQALGTIETVSKSLDEISQLARKSVESAVAGATAVQSVVHGIHAIVTSSEKIGGIVTVISDIADQTNLLALNAAIEAARAGEHGRGFAVVADEVGKLADRSATSTKEIDQLIQEGIKNVTAGVETSRSSEKAMEQIRVASERVNEMITTVSQSMTTQIGAIKELARTLDSVSEMSQSISASVVEQTTNAKDVSDAIEGVNEITQSSASAAEQMSSATDQLSKMAQNLKALMEQFRISAKS